MNFKTDNSLIAVIGLGYVGLPLAVEFGKIRNVLGFDINMDRIKALRSGHDETNEVPESDLRSAKFLTYTSDQELLHAATIFIVTVPTPITVSNTPDLEPLIEASETVGKALKPGDIVIYESTVYPGATEEVCVPTLEKISGLRFNEDFCVGYSPERINPGDREHRLSNVIKVTSGSTSECATVVDQLYQQIVTVGTHRVSSIKVAEAAKIIENTQRDLNIAFVNELAIIFNLMNIDTHEVLNAAKTKWNFMPFKPGLVGGHCIGVDPYYLTHKAQAVGYNPELILAGRHLNDVMHEYVATNLISMMSKNNIITTGATVGIFGVTFKENCPDFRNSKALKLIFEIEKYGIKTKICDPCVDRVKFSNEYNRRIFEFEELTELDAIIIVVEHSHYKKYSAKALRKLCCDRVAPVILDLKSMFGRQELESQGFTVFRL